MNALVRFHRDRCPPYRRIVGDGPDARALEEIPFLHVGLFKRLDLRTDGPEARGRTLLSSSTSGESSRIALDARSSALQEKSARRILEDVVPLPPRPLLILDAAASLLQRGTVPARVAAFMSLAPFSTGIRFLLKEALNPEMDLDALSAALSGEGPLLVYGLSWILWKAWGERALPAGIKAALAGRTVTFVHSGGWKKLEDAAVSRETFDAALLDGLHPDSSVVDFYGLVEQVGVVYPLCPEGFRHPPVWADVVVRDGRSLRPLAGEPGQLQLLNPFAWGAPYHSVYTDDLAVLQPGPCACGRSGKRFRLLGRVPRSETRGCANV
jgi:hypothetical protein